MDSDDKPDTLLVIDTPFYLQFLMVSSLQRLKDGHFGVLEKGVKLAIILQAHLPVGL